MHCESSFTLSSVFGSIGYLHHFFVVVEAGDVSVAAGAIRSDCYPLVGIKGLTSSLPESGRGR